MSVYRVKSAAEIPKHCHIAGDKPDPTPKKQKAPTPERIEVVAKFDGGYPPGEHANSHKRQPKKKAIPTESQEQFAVVEWCALHPVAQWIFAVPNGGMRNRGTAIKMMREGLRSGVPDLILPVPFGRYHGLFIEMKRLNASPSDTSQAQQTWIACLREQGYCVEVCKGADEAIAAIQRYLER